jgi:serine/threonine-protein kinase
MRVTDPFDLVGQTIDGQLRVDSVVGEGGFSVVYRGEHVGLAEPVAIKCLKLPGKLSPAVADSFARRFRDEGRIMYRLSKGNLDIVRSIASGTTTAPNTGIVLPYLALEWLEGRSVAEELRDRRKRMLPPYTWDEAFQLFDSAANAIAYAHSQGIVHRDIKPGNLFMATQKEGARMKVLDFGLAKIVSDEVGFSPSVKTIGNMTFCSPSYGAPEQFDLKLGAMGPWTDVYALALCLLEATHGQKIRPAESLAEALSLALSPNTPLTPRALGVQATDAVEEVFAKAVKMRPTERTQSAGEFWSSLKTAIADKTAPKPKGAPTLPLQAMSPMPAGSAVHGAPHFQPRGGTMPLQAVPAQVLALAAQGRPAMGPGTAPLQPVPSMGSAHPSSGSVQSSAPSSPALMPAAPPGTQALAAPIQPPVVVPTSGPLVSGPVAPVYSSSYGVQVTPGMPGAGGPSTGGMPLAAYPAQGSVPPPPGAAAPNPFSNTRGDLAHTARSPTTGPSTALIVGITLGLGAFLGALAFLTYWFLVRSGPTTGGASTPQHSLLVEIDSCPRFPT